MRRIWRAAALLLFSSELVINALSKTWPNREWWILIQATVWLGPAWFD
jgi:hypothetical protein